MRNTIKQSCWRNRRGATVEKSKRAESSGRRDRRLPEVPPVGRASRESSEGEATGVSRVDLLGQTGPGIRRRGGATADSWTGAGRARSKSHRPHVHGRPFGRFSVCRFAQGGLREPGQFPAPGRWLTPEGHLHLGDVPVRATGEQAAPSGNFELPELPRTRIGNIEAESGPGTGKNCVGRLS